MNSTADVPRTATPGRASQIADHAPIDDAALESSLLNMHPGATLTRGYHESLVNGEVRDLEWNAFDYWHRIYVHHTYNDALQVFSGRHFSVNVTRWGRLPIFIQVANAWLGPGVFLQTMSVLGILYLHQVVRLTQKGEQVLIQVNWYTASHWLLRWLHPFFNRRLLKLQRVQDAEDRQIRDQRYQLRKQGFRFATDDPDFLNSNRLTDHVIVPGSMAAVRMPVASLPHGRIERIEMGCLPFLAKRDGDAVTIWPALCPHEGAPMAQEHLCEGVLQCPWHGRRHKGFELRPAEGQAHWRFLGVTVELQDSDLVMTPDGPEG